MDAITRYLIQFRLASEEMVSVASSLNFPVAPLTARPFCISGGPGGYSMKILIFPGDRTDKWRVGGHVYCYI